MEARGRLGGHQPSRDGDHKPDLSLLFLFFFFFFGAECKLKQNTNGLAAASFFLLKPFVGVKTFLHFPFGPFFGGGGGVKQTRGLAPQHPLTGSARRRWPIMQL